MKKIISLALLALLLVVNVQAETIVLRSGQRYTGTILLQNEEVVVFRDANGKRFQYLMSDVQAVLTEEELAAVTEVVPEETPVLREKKVTVAVQLMGGAAVIPANMTGGAVAGDLAIGSYNLLGKRIFLGGTIGSQTAWLNGAKTFIPLRLRAEIPFLQEADGHRHTPIFGVGVGYGFAANKQYKGGLSAALDLGYRFRVSDKNCFYLGAYTTFQQAQLTITEEVKDQSFTSQANRALITCGVKTALYF